MSRHQISTYSRFLSLVVVAVGISLSAARAADTSAPLTKQQIKGLIKTAKTSDDHMKLARYYWYEADRLKSEAKDHQEMEADYAQNPSAHPVPKWPTLGQHCKDLAEDYAKAASEAEQMASLHEAMAKAAGK